MDYNTLQLTVNSWAFKMSYHIFLNHLNLKYIYKSMASWKTVKYLVKWTGLKKRSVKQGGIISKNLYNGLMILFNTEIFSNSTAHADYMLATYN